MTKAKTLFSEQFSDALNRIRRAYKVLQQIQMPDGAPTFPHGGQPALDDYVSLLLEAGFIRKVDVPNDALQYRVTWKGLSFLDTVALWKQIEQNETADTI